MPAAESVIAESVAVVGAHDDQPPLLRGQSGDQAPEVIVGVGERGTLGREGVLAVAEVVAVGDVGGRDVDEQVQRPALVLSAISRAWSTWWRVESDLERAELGPPVVLVDEVGQHCAERCLAGEVGDTADADASVSVLGEADQEVGGLEDETLPWRLP